MSKTIPGNHKHMTQDDRISIEKGLDNCLSLRKIAEALSNPKVVKYVLKT